MGCLGKVSTLTKLIILWIFPISYIVRERGVLNELLSIVLEIRFEVMTFIEIFNKNLLEIYVFLVKFY